MPYYTTQDKTKLFFADENSSGTKTILFIHGLGASGESWQLQEMYFIKKGFRVLVPDMRGFGKSEFFGHHLPIKRMAEDMAELLDYLTIQKTIVVGISMGGVIALSLTLNHPEKVERLVLTNTFAALRPKDISSWAYFLQRMILVHFVGIEKQAEVVASRIFPDPGQSWLRDELKRQILLANPSAYRAVMRSLGLFDVRHRLGSIIQPTLIITGEKDSTVPAEIQKYLVDHIPGSRQVIIAEGGHAVTAQYPEEYNKNLADFCESETDSS